jgi:hypothetical protein
MTQAIPLAPGLRVLLVIDFRIKAKIKMERATNDVDFIITSDSCGGTSLRQDMRCFTPEHRLHNDPSAITHDRNNAYLGRKVERPRQTNWIRPGYNGIQVHEAHQLTDTVFPVLESHSIYKHRSSITSGNTLDFLLGSLLHDLVCQEVHCTKLITRPPQFPGASGKVLELRELIESRQWVGSHARRKMR